MTICTFNVISCNLVIVGCIVRTLCACICMRAHLPVELDGIDS